MQEVFKVIGREGDGRIFSVIASYPARVEYRPGEWTRPIAAYGKLLAFSKLEEAKSFMKEIGPSRHWREIEVWKGLCWGRPEEVWRVLWTDLTSDTKVLSDFWRSRRWKVHPQRGYVGKWGLGGKFCSVWPPRGTVACRALKILDWVF